MSRKAFRSTDEMDGFVGVPLLALFPGSPADQAGLQAGDLIVAVNGMRTRDVADYVSAKELDPARMHVVFVRASAYYEATMHWAHDDVEPRAEAIAAGRAAILASSRSLGILGGRGSPSPAAS